MRDTNLAKALREHAEWAEGNQWETPITLCDDLTEAADLIDAKAKEIDAFALCFCWWALSSIWIAASNKFRDICRAESMIFEYRRERDAYLRVIRAHMRHVFVGMTLRTAWRM